MKVSNIRPQSTVGSPVSYTIVSLFANSTTVVGKQSCIFGSQYDGQWQNKQQSTLAHRKIPDCVGVVVTRNSATCGLYGIGVELNGSHAVINIAVYLTWMIRPVVSFTIIGVHPKPSTAPGLGVCEWSPEGLYNKTVSWIPNTDEILKLLKKKMNYSVSTWAEEGLGASQLLIF